MKTNGMLECPACGNEISKEAVNCPKCGHIIKKKNKGCGCLIAIFIFLGIIIFSVVAAIMSFDKIEKDITEEITGVEEESEYITLEEYNKIEAGMTYDEVCEIIGSKGSDTANSSVNGYTVKIVTWYGNGTLGSNANVTFENGKVTGKAQVGLR